MSPTVLLIIAVSALVLQPLAAVAGLLVSRWWIDRQYGKDWYLREGRRIWGFDRDE